MRVLHLVHQYLPEHIGGTELYTRWLSQYLRQAGHENIIFHRRSGEGIGLDGWIDEAGSQIWAAWSGQMTPQKRFRAAFSEPGLLAAFEQVLQQAQPDVVHVQHLMGLPPALIDRLKQAHLPFVMTLHDYWWICANAQLLTNYNQQLCAGPQAYLNCSRCALARAGRSNLWPALPPLAGLLAWRNRQLRSILWTAHRLIAPSQFVADWYAHHGAPAERLVVIPHGLDAPELPPRLARQPGQPVRFAYIGGLSQQKGVHVVLEAFNEIDTGAELWIAGDESADPAYVIQLRAKASAQVHFLGKLSRAEVWSRLNQVDVVLVPSLWHETFSFIVSEAFAAGVPVIASRVGALTERVRHGLDGWLVPPDDSQAWREAMQQFLDDPTLLPRLQANIRPGWSMAAHGQAIEAIYHKL